MGRSTKVRAPANVKDATMNLTWSPNFATSKQEMFKDVQAFIDSECIRLMKPYTPMLSGLLYKSATIGTKIGSGEIIYASPYARFQYYGKVMVSPATGSPWAKKGESKVLTDKDLVHSTMRHPQAGPYWFERMKSEKLETIKRGIALRTKKGESE